MATLVDESSPLSSKEAGANIFSDLSTVAHDDPVGDSKLEPAAESASSSTLANVPAEGTNAIFVFLRRQGVPLTYDGIDLSELGTSGPRLQAAVLKVLRALLPEAKEITDPSEIDLRRLSGALTNCVFVVSWRPKTPHVGSHAQARLTPTPTHRVLLRVYGSGTDKFIHRERELVFMTRLSNSGVGPKLLGAFPGGRLEEFIESSTLTSKEIRIPDMSDKIAAELCRFNLLGPATKKKQARRRSEPLDETASHFDSPAATLFLDESAGSGAAAAAAQASLTTINGDGAQRPSAPADDVDIDDELPVPEIWDRVEKWYTLTLECMEELKLKKDPEFLKRLDALNVESYGAEVQWLKKRLDAVDSPLVFGHNDLQYGNILRRTDGNLLFVDYEYSGYNFRGADIANHFCEWSADYHTDYPHELDYVSKYPTVAEQRRFCGAYLDALRDFTGEGKLAGEERDQAVDALVAEVDAYCALVHLHWGFWGIMQALDNDYVAAPDFDYLQYGAQRFWEYDRRKKLMEAV